MKLERPAPCGVIYRMASRFQHVALVGRFHTPGMDSILEDLARLLEAQGIQVSLEASTAQAAQSPDLKRRQAIAADRLGSLCDLAIVVGGDGTMLGIARQLARDKVPLIGINQGRLGFITDIPKDALEAQLLPMLEGHFVEEQRTMLEGDVTRDGQRIFSAPALNDAVVSRGASASMVELRVDIGQEFVCNVRADGLIVSSPTGSTAYALSAGGPLLHPSVAAWLMVPIAPHDLSNRPIVLPDSGEVRMEIISGKDASVSFDMQSLARLMPGDVVTVRRSPYTVRFLHPLGWSYYSTLRRKLHWNSGAGSQRL